VCWVERGKGTQGEVLTRRSQDPDSGSRFCLGFMVQGLGLRVDSLCVMVYGLGFMVEGSGCRV